jgi:hypothetical protein
MLLLTAGMWSIVSVYITSGMKWAGCSWFWWLVLSTSVCVWFSFFFFCIKLWYKLTPKPQNIVNGSNPVFDEKRRDIQINISKVAGYVSELGVTIVFCIWVGLLTIPNDCLNYDLRIYIFMISSFIVVSAVYVLVHSLVMICWLINNNKHKNRPSINTPVNTKSGIKPLREP